MKNSNNGQSMFEVMLALAVASVILIAIVSLAGKSIGNSTYSREENLAQNYSKELSEWIKKEKETSWTSLVANLGASTDWCMIWLGWGAPTTSSSCGVSDYITGTKYIRSVNFGCYEKNSTSEVSLNCSNSGVNLVKYSIITSWTDSTGIHNSSINSSLSNWVKP